MLIDSSDIHTQNDKLIRSSQWCMENIEFSNKAIDVLRAASYLPLDNEDDITLLRLAIRLINSAGAAGIATLNGYYQPAASNIRDIIEVSFLLDLFGREASHIARWRTADKKIRHKLYRPIAIRNALDKLDGKSSTFRDKAYKIYSEHGTHMHESAVILMSPNNNTIIGPFPDAERVLALSYDIARYLSAGAYYLLEALPDRELVNSEKLNSFQNFMDVFLSAIEPWNKRTNEPDTPVSTT